MKTPMQEHIEWMQDKLRILVEYKDLSEGAEVDECIQHAEAMLYKEKEVINNAYITGFSDRDIYHQAEDDYYNETFNTKEK
jgi:hypothetical protein